MRKFTEQRRPTQESQSDYLLKKLNLLRARDLASVLIKFCLGPDFEKEENITGLLQEVALSPREQQIFILTILEKKSSKDAAKEMNLLPQQINDNLNKGITKLYQHADKLAAQKKGHIE